MIIIYGKSPVVSLVKWNGRDVWTTGLKTPKNILQTYMSQCIMVVNKIEDLMWDMSNIYVINEGDMNVAEEVVLRGGFCLNCNMDEGLWKLRHVLEYGV